jgi:hypothetical protein
VITAGRAPLLTLHERAQIVPALWAGSFFSFIKRCPSFISPVRGASTFPLPLLRGPGLSATD